MAECKFLTDPRLPKIFLESNLLTVSGLSPLPKLHVLSFELLLAQIYLEPRGQAVGSQMKPRRGVRAHGIKDCG